MKTRYKLSIVTLGLLFLSSGMIAQKGGGGHGGRGGHGSNRNHGGNHKNTNHVVVIKRSHYRPAKMVVFHPHWRPSYAYHRRWVYFPRYNFYWDNWRNQYVFWNGNIWLSQATVPAMIVNVNLEKEKSNELKENEDDDDDIYKSNDNHKTAYQNE